jgi:hypothetical protein
MYFGHLRVFLAIGLLFFPLGLLITGVPYALFRVGGLNGLVDSAGSSNAVVDSLAFALGIVITLFGLAVVIAASAVAMIDIDAGRATSAVAAYMQVLPKLRSLLGTVLAAAVLITALGLTSIGVLLDIWLIVRWSFLAHVVAVEGTQSPLRRSAHLVRGSWWRIASMLLFVTLLALLLGPVVGTLLVLVSSASFDFVNLISGVVYAAVLPFAAIATTYLYFDRWVAEQREARAEEAGDILPAEGQATWG